ncbi:MAG: phosphatidate cytidylyltransferase [Chlorobiaceae bacterium]|nr:phosphatidate cytidylyltransferase [Chlorobiaceae bacterium]
MSHLYKTAKIDHDPNRLDYRFEFARKSIHLSSLLIPLIYWYIGRKQALLIIVPITAGFLFVDVFKNFIPSLSKWYHETFGSMLRHHELNKERLHLNGATWITLSALILIAFFPKTIAVAAFAMVSVSDTMAALVGKKFGRHRFGEKSLEGSLAFFISAFIVVSVVPGLLLPVGAIMALAGTIAEALTIRIDGLKIDDNLTVPIASALAGIACYAWLFPSAMGTILSFP